MASHAARGKAALEASDPQTAIRAYSDAIKEAPSSPDYFIQRSTALQRAGDIAAALRDAEQAVLNAQRRGKRDRIVDAQFRRGIALWHLGRFGDAAFVFGVVKRMSPEYKMAPIWIRKTELSLEGLPADDERRTCTVLETPTPPESSEPQTTQTAVSEPAKMAVPQQTPASKIRHEWYQNTEHVYFTLLAKGVPPDRAQIDIGPRALSIAFPTVADTTYELTFDPLFAEVVPEKCVTRVLATKVEVVLVKATPGQKWAALESSEPVAAPTTNAPQPASPATTKAESKPAPPTTQPSPSAPAYPTSSKSGPKNWDTIAAADDDDDDDGGDPANAFFKKLFKGASPEMQRAMMKSYTESNGTALSTNWDEVSKGPVATVPPEGMEARKWND